MRAEDVKVGMKVVPHDKTGGCTTWESFNTDDGDCCTSFYLNNGFLIVAFILKDGRYSLGCGRAHGLEFRASDFEPATIEVGDTVRVINNDGYGGCVYGIEGTVHSVRPRGRFEIWSDNPSFDANKCAFRAETLELVRKAKKPEQPEQKKEEKKVSKRPEKLTVRHLVMTRGEGIGFIIHATNGTLMIVTKKLVSSVSQCCFLSAAKYSADRYGIIATKLLPEQATAMQYVMDGKEPTAWDWREEDDKPVYKVGDWVEVVSAPKCWVMCPGDKGQITTADDTHLPYCVRRNDGVEGWFRADQIKPCPPPAPKTITAADLKKQFGENVVLNLDGQTIAVK